MPQSRLLLASALLVVATGCGSTGSGHTSAHASSSPSPAVEAQQSRLIQYSVGDEGTPELWEFDLARPGSQHRIATWPGGTNGFARSPDGSLLATVTPTGVDLLRVDGSHRTEAFAFPDGSTPAGPAVWSPDSQRIAVPVQPAAIVVAVVDGSQQQSVAPGGTGPVWAPDSRHLTYTAHDRALMLHDVDGTAVPAQLAAAGSYPVWSPDGARIAFAGATPQTLVLARSDGSAPVQVGSGDLAAGASWSPDGRQFAFTVNSALTVVNADGSELHTLLTPDQAGDLGLCPGPEGVRCAVPMSCPTWTGSAQLVFRAVELAQIATDGTGVKQLTRARGREWGVSCPFLVPSINGVK